MRAEEVCAPGLPQTQFLTEFAEIVMNISCSVLLLTSFGVTLQLQSVCANDEFENAPIRDSTPNNCLVCHSSSRTKHSRSSTSDEQLRLGDILSGNDDSSKFEDLSIEDRVAIIEIIRDTKQGLPKYWLNAPVARISDRQDWWSPEN